MRFRCSAANVSVDVCIHAIVHELCVRACVHVRMPIKIVALLSIGEDMKKHIQIILTNRCKPYCSYMMNIEGCVLFSYDSHIFVMFWQGGGWGTRDTPPPAAPPPPPEYDKHLTNPCKLFEIRLNL